MPSSFPGHSAPVSSLLRISLCACVWIPPTRLASVLPINLLHLNQRLCHIGVYSTVEIASFSLSTRARPVFVLLGMDTDLKCTGHVHIAVLLDPVGVRVLCLCCAQELAIRLARPSLAIVTWSDVGIDSVDAIADPLTCHSCAGCLVLGAGWMIKEKMRGDLNARTR